MGGMSNLVSNFVMRGRGTDGNAFATSSKVMKDWLDCKFCNKLHVCSVVVFPFFPPNCSGDSRVSAWGWMVDSINFVSMRYIAVVIVMGR